jgi:hypothetical protein
MTAIVKPLAGNCLEAPLTPPPVGWMPDALGRGGRLVGSLAAILRGTNDRRSARRLPLPPIGDRLGFYRVPRTTHLISLLLQPVQSRPVFWSARGLLVRSAHAHAWFNGNSDRKTHPVGQKRPNAWGLYDMHGNVWEWCWVAYHADYYKQSDGADPRCSSQAASRVIRGGSWDFNPLFCRSADRFKITPESRYRDLGFRVAPSPVCPVKRSLERRAERAPIRPVKRSRRPRNAPRPSAGRFDVRSPANAPARQEPRASLR